MEKITLDSTVIQEIANQLGIAVDQVWNFAPEYGRMIFERSLYGLIGMIIFTLISGIIAVTSIVKFNKHLKAEEESDKTTDDEYGWNICLLVLTCILVVVFLVSFVALIVSLFFFGDTLAWLNHPQAKLVETVVQQISQ